MSVPAVIEFDGASYSLNGTAILREVCLRAEPGETVVLLGPSGAGKSTALRMVNGLLRPSAGRVLVNGAPTTAQNPVRLKRACGYVIQEIVVGAGDVQENFLERADIGSEFVGVFLFGPIFGHGD